MSSCETVANNVIYISNFPKKLPKQVLEETLKEYGVLLSLNIIYKHDFSFAFAQFDDIRDAAFAVKELNQKLYHGMNLKVQYKNKKIKQKELEIEEILKKETVKNSQSPQTTFETTCSILPSKVVEQLKVEKNIIHHTRQYDRRKNSRQSISSNISLSRSKQRSRQRSRSRRKNYRRPRNYENRQPYLHEQQRRPRQKSLEKYQNRISQRKYRSEESEIAKMLDVIKKMGKDLRCIQQKLEDLIFDSKYESRQPSRRRK